MQDPDKDVLPNSQPDLPFFFPNNHSYNISTTPTEFLRSSMEHTSIIPNCNIILIPLESDLQIMILRNKFKQIFQNSITFVFSHFPNAFCEFTVHKESFPACYGIGSNDRVDRFKDFTDVVWGSSFIAADFAAVTSCDYVETVG